MNYCKHLKKRKNKPFCTLLNKEISLSECCNCINKEYKLSDIFEAKTLYAMYPELKDMTIEFKGMKKSKNGNYNSIANKITVNNTLINDLNNLRGPLLHEIQHYIQKKRRLSNRDDYFIWK